MPNTDCFQTVALALAGHAVVSRSLRGFQQLRELFHIQLLLDHTCDVIREAFAHPAELDRRRVALVPILSKDFLLDLGCHFERRLQEEERAMDISGSFSQAALLQCSGSEPDLEEVFAVSFELYDVEEGWLGPLLGVGLEVVFKIHTRMAVPDAGALRAPVAIVDEESHSDSPDVATRKVAYPDFLRDANVCVILEVFYNLVLSLRQVYDFLT